MRKQGFYSAIKIGGFALGIATCLLIALYIRFELSFDTMYPNGDRLYRVIQTYKEDNGNVGKGPAMAAPLAQAVMAEFPQIELAGHELWNGEQTTRMAQNYDTYVLMKPGADVQLVQKKLVDMFARLWLPQMTQAGVADPQGILKRVSFELQPVKKIALFSYDISDSFHHGDIRFVWLFGAVGIFILLLACVNFINLSTARSANRAKEVGLRKVVGSPRSGLVRQFLLESLVLSYVSFLLAVVLAWALLPLFDRMTDIRMSFPWLEWWLSPMLLLAATVIGVLAGLYPAVYLSAFRPAEVLKGVVARGSRGSGLRSTLVVYRQMQYIMNRDLGYNKDQVMLIQGTGTLDKQQFTFKDELLKLPGVKAASVLA